MKSDIIDNICNCLFFIVIFVNVVCIYNGIYVLNKSYEKETKEMKVINYNYSNQVFQLNEKLNRLLDYQQKETNILNSMIETNKVK